MAHRSQRGNSITLYGPHITAHNRGSRQKLGTIQKHEMLQKSSNKKRIKNKSCFLKSTFFNKKYFGVRK